MPAIRTLQAIAALVVLIGFTQACQSGFLEATGGIPANQAPVARNQSVSLYNDATVAIILAAEDEDSADVLSYSIESNPEHGTLSGSAPNLIYTPTANYVGTDSFTFKAKDGKDSSELATVSITVLAASSTNVAPIATPQTISTNEDTAKSITLAATDADGNELSYAIVGNPAHGSLGAITGATVNYTPNANYFGPDAFTFKANDGTVDSSTVTVTVTVVPVNDAPVAVAQSVTLSFNNRRSITLAGTDIDGNAIVSYTVVTSPTKGTLSGSGASRIYTATPGQSGADSFTFKVNDGTLESVVATVSISIISPLYWYNDGSQPNANWDTQENWWTDEAHTVPASRLPQDGDYLIFLGSNSFDTAPATLISLAGFDSTGLIATVPAFEPMNIAIGAHGTLRMGVPWDPFNTILQNWKGTSHATAKVTFYGGAVALCASADPTISGDVTFNEGSANGCRVSGNATFNDSSSNLNYVLGLATFYDSSINQGALNDVVFNDSSHNSGGITGHATFNGSSHNDTEILGDATFNDNSNTFLGSVAGISTWGAGNPNVAADDNSHMYLQGSDWSNYAMWWTNPERTIPANRRPKNGDYVLLVDVLTTAAPALTLGGLDLPGGVDENGLYHCDLIIGAAGTLTVGTGGGDNSPVKFCGSTADASVDVNFRGGGILASTISGHAEFFDNASNLGTVTGHAQFFNNSSSVGVVTGNVTANDAAIVSGTIGGNVVVNDNAWVDAMLTGSIRFNSVSNQTLVVPSGAYWRGSPSSALNLSGQTITQWIFFDAYNSGTFNGDAFFNGGSWNNGTVNGNVVFDGSAENIGSQFAIVNGNATFYGNSLNSGTVLGNADFRDTSRNNGTVNGTVICDTTGDCTPSP